MVCEKETIGCFQSEERKDRLKLLLLHWREEIRRSFAASHLVSSWNLIGRQEKNVETWHKLLRSFQHFGQGGKKKKTKRKDTKPSIGEGGSICRWALHLAVSLKKSNEVILAGNFIGTKNANKVKFFPLIFHDSFCSTGNAICATLLSTISGLFKTRWGGGGGKIRALFSTKNTQRTCAVGRPYLTLAIFWSRFANSCFCFFVSRELVVSWVIQLQGAT